MLRSRTFRIYKIYFIMYLKVETNTYVNILLYFKETRVIYFDYNLIFFFKSKYNTDSLTGWGVVRGSGFVQLYLNATAPVFRRWQVSHVHLFKLVYSSVYRSGTDTPVYQFIWLQGGVKNRLCAKLKPKSQHSSSGFKQPGNTLLCKKLLVLKPPQNSNGLTIIWNEIYNLLI